MGGALSTIGERERGGCSSLLTKSTSENLDILILILIKHLNSNLTHHMQRRVLTHSLLTPNLTQYFSARQAGEERLDRGGWMDGFEVWTRTSMGMGMGMRSLDLPDTDQRVGSISCLQCLLEEVGVRVPTAPHSPSGASMI